MKSLTARVVETLKPKPGQRAERADHVVRGLSIRVTQAGVKSWALRYRNISGEQRRLTLGTFPAMSLEKARDAALRALGQIADRRDPAQERSTERRHARRARVEKAKTLADLWRHYSTNYLPSKRPSTIAYNTWLWDQRIAPTLGAQRLEDLDRPSIRAALREIGAVTPIQANRVGELLRRLFNVAVEDGVVATTPLANMGRLFVETSRDRVLDDVELTKLWRALDMAPSASAIGVSPRMRLALKLTMLTGARAGDIVGMRGEEIDVVTRTWTIPANRYKAKRAHSIPLSATAWALVTEALGQPNSASVGPLFPNARDPSATICRASLTRAMGRVCASAGIVGATAHDLRRTVATYLASERIGVAPHVVAAVLGHAAEGSAVTAIYNRHRYDSEKRNALAAWDAVLNEIVKCSQSHQFMLS